MTLILDCIARDAVFQVSDRRLTDAYGGTVVDDQSNKAVVVDGRVVFGYTGLATIDGQRTRTGDSRWAYARYGNGGEPYPRESNSSFLKTSLSHIVQTARIQGNRLVPTKK